MAFKFNPFTGTLDQTGSGGGGSSYIDGEVQNFSALPETIGSPAVDSAYLVREAEGTWLLARKPAGIYIRTADTGVRAADWTHAGAFPDVFNDANFLLYDNGDPTKNLQFQLSGLTTATTSTLTVPPSGTIARTEDFAAPPAIGSTTPAAGSFTTLNANGTGSADLVAEFGTAAAGRNHEIQIWGNGAGRNHRIIASTSAGIAFGLGTAQPTMVVSAGTPQGFRMFSGAALQWTSHGSNANTGTVDTTIFRDAADTLAQRRSTNPQTYRIYNTFTDANNHERGFMRWSSNVLQIGTEKDGTGTARALEFQTGGVTRMGISTAGVLTLTETNTLTVSPNVAGELIGGAAVVRLDAVRLSLSTGGADRMSISAGGDIFIRAGSNLALTTTTGTKIGTATNQKIGFFNATPVVQQAAVADATDAASTQARLNDLLARLRTLGLIAT